MRQQINPVLSQRYGPIARLACSALLHQASGVRNSAEQSAQSEPGRDRVMLAQARKHAILPTDMIAGD
jgi:hypothetical protein